VDSHYLSNRVRFPFASSSFCLRFNFWIKIFVSEHGYDSVGIDQNSVVHSVCEFRARVATVIDHWGCALVEKFIDGREFSVLIVGDKSQSYVYAPVEYKFDATREKSAFITFDDKVA
jgi:hypothetical protein